MPRQRAYYSTSTHALPDDFPQRLERFQKESGLSWSEIARRIGTYQHTVWSWPTAWALLTCLPTEAARP